ncbi:MAG: DUF4382 domain-containing protein [Bacteroidales bacterium]|nr:DUF4382 domain-containing protein [Bacteroidales bacterium]
MRQLRNFAFLFTLIGLTAFLITSCQKDADLGGKTTGTLHLSITDAPIDAYDITGVFITITGIEYNQENTWMVLEEFDGPVTLNLLELTDGISAQLGSFELEAGTYTQLRFMLDAPEMGNGSHANPGCYLEFGDGTTEPLFVPSGAQTGYKAVGEFIIPAEGDIYVTADFDVRKSVVVAGNSGKFILKPTIRLVVEDRSGEIEGTLLNMDEETEGLGYLVYIYEAGTYDEAEADDPAEEEPRFPNAISSKLVDEDGNFMFAFLPEGLYDLVLITTLDGEFSEVLGLVEEIEVIRNVTTVVEIDITGLE